MPVCFDPSMTFTVHVAADAEKPEGERPVFTFRYAPARQWIAIAEFLDSIGTSDRTARAEVEGLAALLAPLLTGWRNIPHAFNPDNLLDVVNPTELMELAHGVLGALRPANTTTGSEV